MEKPSLTERGGNDMRASLIKDTPFDQYNRQYQVAKILDTIRTAKTPLRVLDVGGYKGKTTEFLANDEVTILDLYDCDDANYVKGSGLDLPFKDNSFDVVVNFDVLEHIPPKDRLAFFDECHRVAKLGIILAAPHKTEVNEDAEQKLNNLYRTLHGKDHEWLEEHIAYGLPDFTAMREHAVQKGTSINTFCSNDTMLWALMQGPIFLNSKFPYAVAELLRINEFYNVNLKHDAIDEDHSYRLIVCCWKDEALQKAVQKLEAKQPKRIDGVSKIDLIDVTHQFYTTLLTKQSTQLSNYEELYKHELNRSSQLQANGEELWQTINELNAEKQAMAERYQSEHPSWLAKKLKKDHKSKPD